MSFSYRLTKNLMQRNASYLVAALNELSTSIFLCKEDNNRKVNGKSLNGILSGHFLQGNIVKIFIDNNKELNKIKEIFNEIGSEIQEVN